MAFPRLENALNKLGWGVRTVGVPTTALGVVRLAVLRIRRPARSRVVLRRSGAVLDFDYPAQVAPVLVLFGDVIDPEYAFLERTMGPGSTFLDVGASIGLFSVTVARLTGASGHAFEPVAQNLDVLRHNVDQNGLSGRVLVHQMGLADHPGEASFGSGDSPWMSRLAASGPEGGVPPTDLVPIDTLTAACERLGIDHVSVLKVNVAGYEPEVLRGAEDFLRQGRADVLILLVGTGSFDSYRTIADMGYRFFHFHPGRSVLHEVTQFDQEGIVGARPWPARHIIAIRSEAIEQWLRGTVKIAPAVDH